MFIRNGLALIGLWVVIRGGQQLVDALRRGWQDASD